MSDDWWFFPESAASHWTNSSSASIALAHNLCLLLFVCYKNTNHGTELSDMPSLMKPLYIVTMMTYFSFLFYNITAILLSVPEIYESVTCSYLLQALIMLYTFSKYSLWLFSLTRIYVIFSADVVNLFGYSSKTLRNIFIILTVCFLQNMILLMVAVSGKEVFINKDTSFCAYVVHYMLLIIYIHLVDQWCSIACFLLFYRKMKSLNALEKSFADGAESIELKYVLRKYTILLATNILSSWMATLIVTFTPFGITAGQIDTIINMWTVVLFDVKYDKIYIAIFGCIATAIPKVTNDEATLSQHIDDNGSLNSTVTMVIHSCTKNESKKTELSASLRKNIPLQPPKLYAFAQSEPLPNNRFKGKHAHVSVQSASLES